MEVARPRTRRAVEGGLPRRLEVEPFYAAQADEVEVFEAACRQRLPVLLKGPTGCGKTRLVEHLAWRTGRPIVTVACHDDLSVHDLTGRYLIRGAETVWQDGPLAVAARLGALCYLDELTEARQDTVVAIHPLADDRRLLPLDKKPELIEAHPDFQLVISYNPDYQGFLKELKPSTRQRFVAIALDVPRPDLETGIVCREAGVDAALAAGLVSFAGRVRRLRDRGLVEGPSTRLLVQAARLVASGMTERRACEVAVALPVSDDPELLEAILGLARATFPD